MLNAILLWPLQLYIHMIFDNNTLRTVLDVLVVQHNITVIVRHMSLVHLIFPPVFDSGHVVNIVVKVPIVSESLRAI